MQQLKLMTGNAIWQVIEPDNNKNFCFNEQKCISLKVADRLKQLTIFIISELFFK
jgi:hypothetical protein